MPSCQFAALFLVFKKNFSGSELHSSHAPAYYIFPLSLAHIFLLDFSGEFSLGNHFNGFVVRTLQGVARAQDPRPEQAEFNTSLCFVSRQSKPTTPLQSLSPAGAPPVLWEQDSEEARPS